MTRTRGKNRPASVRLAEAQEKARRLERKAAIESLGEHPSLAPFQAAVKDANQAVLNAARYIKQGEEKAATFRQRAILWEQRKEESELAIGDLRAQHSHAKAALDMAMDELIESSDSLEGEGEAYSEA